ncbi:type II toxin-antitoxin system RelE/ParE family toxin [Terricaulis sp.]|uniref:type II toxin-antitoxin system RelE/ParE family toxin n=1 Tax=Terricaulis sp. TaxID=2768686 RepID=UPI003784E65C
MIRSFKGHWADALHRLESPGKGFPADLVRIAQRKLAMLNAAVRLENLRVPPGNRLEALAGDRNGQHSIRINDQWRICFKWTDAGPEDVEIVDYH